MIKKTSLFLFVILLSTILSAQNIVVESFTHLETDLTANLDGTTVYDQNGEKCALIKVRSNPPTKDFIFDLGVLGVVETRYDGPDIWLYVPYGVKKITIKHPQLGVLENYDLGMSLKKATTYMLSLRVGRVQTIIEEQPTKQYLHFNITPADAFLEVNGEVWSLENGSVAKLLDYGRYEYRISAKDYHDEVGIIDLGGEKKSLKVDLRPAYGWIEVKGSGDLVGAKVYVDNIYVGNIPFKSDKLSSGQHMVRVAQKMYKDYLEKVTISDNQTLTILPTLKQNFATVTFKTLDDSEIWIDRELRGKAPWTGRVEYGDHEIEIKKASHRSQKKVYTIDSESNGITINLPQPIPIYGSLNVDTKPFGASVYVDGELKGETPLLLSKILVGEHFIEVKKSSKETIRKAVVISEGETSTISGTLQEAKIAIKIKSMTDDATLKINGEFRGVLPWSGNLVPGNYKIEVEKEGCDSYVKDYALSLSDTILIIPELLCESSDEDEEVFMVVEEMPEFPGGMYALMKYFSENMLYPKVAVENGIQGRVLCQFTVWKDGSIRDIVVVRGVDRSLDREAVRLIENMPKWKPAKQRGKAVACKYTVPVSFRLQ